MRKLYALSIVLMFVPWSFSQNTVRLPKILGVAHVAFRVKDLNKSRVFYDDLLGYQEPFSLADSNGNAAIAFVKVNDKQYIELFRGDEVTQGQLDHFALYTDDLENMKAYLLSQGITLQRDIHKSRVGNEFLTIKDPDGHPIEILQYSAEGLMAGANGKFMSSDRASDHITHVGILVNSVGGATKFYRDVLGFREFARGGGTTSVPGWIDLRVPDGNDYVEFLPYSGSPSSAQIRLQNHICLGTSNVQKLSDTISLRASSRMLSSKINVETGGNLPPRTNLYDPDGARIEIMQSTTQEARPSAHSQ